jgi:mono/diheme cytochrome c family protein
MEQIKYILYSVLILVGAAVTYAVMEPMVKSQWIAQPNKAVTVDTETPKWKAVKNIAGRNLFSANCQTCHSVQKDLTGPALAGVETRGPWTKRENLVKWVKNPAAFIPTMLYTRELAAKYNGQVMPSFSHLSEQEINQIFDYISEASAQAPEAVQ